MDKKRLRFKRGPSKEGLKGVTPDVTAPDGLDVEVPDIHSCREGNASKSAEIPSSTSTQPVEVEEYGKPIDGYRFVAINKSEIPENSDEEVEQESAEEYQEWTRQGGSFSYDDYVELWETIDETEQLPGYIPLPTLANSWENLDSKNIAAFLGSSDNIRLERIRWHPDKMIPRLQRMGVSSEVCSGYEDVVTKVFQLINEVYDV